MHENSWECILRFMLFLFFFLPSNWLSIFFCKICSLNWWFLAAFWCQLVAESSFLGWFNLSGAVRDQFTPGWLGYGKLWVWSLKPSYLEDRSRNCKWLGSPPFVSHKIKAICKGNNPILRGLANHGYEPLTQWDDPPSIFWDYNKPLKGLLMATRNPARKPPFGCVLKPL